MGPYSGIKLLGAGASLGLGESLVSPSGNARFTIQPDGNAVVYQVQPDGTEKCMFATHTHAGNPAALGAGASFVIQEDDNCVLYDRAGKPVWATNTVEKGVGRVTLALGDNGVLVLVDEADPPTAVWNSGPRGIKAAFESLSAGATYLAERGTYYASDAYEKSKVVAAKTLDQAKEYGAQGVDQAKAFGEKVKAQSTEVYHAAAEKAGAAYEVAKDKAAVVADKATDAAGKVADKAQGAYAAARK
jgi:hypothetical protein